MISLIARDGKWGRLHFDIDGDSVHVVAASGQDDDEGRAEVASMRVSIEDAEVWLARMLDCVRKARAVKP